MRMGLSVRTLMSAFFVIAGLMVAGAVQADAASPSACPSGFTAISSYATLQTDVANAYETGLSNFCLTASLADSASTSGGLSIDDNDNSVTLDLNGYSLTITNAGPGNAGVNTGVGGLTVEDTSAAQTGALTATGGDATATVGAGAGIGASGGTGSSSSIQNQNGPLIVEGGTVTATGGSASFSGTNVSGAGAGVGGGGGQPSDPGGWGGGTEVSGGTLIAAGGSTSGSTLNEGGAGAGIGGGGGAGPSSGNSASGSGGVGLLEVVDGGTIDASGGSATSGGTDDAGAGAGIGGGGAGGSSSGPNAISGAEQFDAEGGEVDVTGGTTTGAVAGMQSAEGEGDGGGAVPAPSEPQDVPYTASAPAVFVVGPTTTISGEWDAISVYGGAIAAVKPGATLQIGAHPIVISDGDDSFVTAPNDSDIEGTLSVPSNSTLSAVEETVSVGTDTIAGAVNVADNSTVTFQSSETFAGAVKVDATSTLYDAGGTLAGGATIDGTLQASGNLTIPSGATLTLNGSGSVNAGTLDLDGTLTGSGALDNQGNIALGSGASVPGNGQGDGGQLSITGNDYLLTFSVPSPGTAPPDQYVFADTVADGGETLPAQPAVPGYETDGGWSITNSTLLGANATNGVVPVSGLYVVDGSVSSNPSLSYGAPTEVTITTGGTDTDVATIYPASGTVTETPTGTETFYVCGPSTIVAYCNSRAEQVGNPVTVSAGPDNTATATSPAFTATAAGYYCFNAVYNGDPFNGVSSDGSTDTQCFYAGAAGTEVSTPTASQPETTEGQPVLLSTTVTDSVGPTVPDSGTVTFFVNGTQTLCIAEVINGQASCQTSGLPTGTDSITARYEGDAGFSQSVVSGALQEIVEPNNEFTVENASVVKANAVSVQLKVPHTGTVRVVLSSGRHAISHSGTVTLAKTAKTKTVAVKLAIRSLLRSVLHGRAGTVTLRVAITYTPTGGKARTVIKTIRVRVPSTAKR